MSEKQYMKFDDYEDVWGGGWTGEDYAPYFRLWCAALAQWVRCAKGVRVSNLGKAEGLECEDFLHDKKKSGWFFRMMKIDQDKFLKDLDALTQRHEVILYCQRIESEFR